MKYKKKPEFIEAVIFNGTRDWDDIPQWLIRATQIDPLHANSVSVFPPNGRVVTEWGPVEIKKGDYIVYNENGSLNAMSPEEFHQNYDSVE